MYIQKVSCDAAYSPESQVSTSIKNTGLYVRFKKIKIILERCIIGCVQQRSSFAIVKFFYYDFI